MERRDFLKGAIVAGAAIGAMGPVNAQEAAADAARVSRVKEPTAIAMWDFSWLLRHHPKGEFEDFDRVLDALVARGYNAIRVDAFPHLIGQMDNGAPVEEFYFPKPDWRPVMWGNQYSMRAKPRESLIALLTKCREREIHVGLSTWFFGPGVEKITGLDGFVECWERTLSFIESHGLLSDIYYVDLLNEYPMFHGFKWFEDELKAIKERELGQSEDPAEKERQAFQWEKDFGAYIPAQRTFYNDFINSAIDRLRAKWPGLDFFACQTSSDGTPWANMDFSRFAVLDVHCWFCLNSALSGETGYWENIHGLADNDLKFPDINTALLANWSANKPALQDWMRAFMTSVAAKGRELNVPFGNTEGWGIINWLDHPALDWTIMKEAAEFCALTGRELGYTFNCTSNFTHPQFPTFWADVEWHKRVTSIIRGI